MSLNLALIGAGTIAKAHLAAIEALKGQVAVTAVIDPNPVAREGAVKRTGAKGFESADAFFASKPRELAQAALVCTPPSARITIVGRALQSGLAVLAETPIAHRLADAQALLGMSYQYRGVVAAVAYCHRFTPAMVEMKKRADTGELGTVLRFEATFASWRPTLEKTWVSDPAISGGGALIDTGSHGLDLYRYLVGDGAIASATVHELWKGRGETSATVQLLPAKTAKHTKATGLIQVGWQEPSRFTVRLTGTKISLAYDYDEPETLVVTPSEGEATAVKVASHEGRYERQLQAFASLIGSKAPEVRPANFEDGSQVAKLVDEATRARVVI
ncbi:MAG: Gfo/Idh/MocA family oxidoreductase [Tepidisphaeraceae bacterium]